MQLLLVKLMNELLPCLFLALTREDPSTPLNLEIQKTMKLWEHVVQHIDIYCTIFLCEKHSDCVKKKNENFPLCFCALITNGKRYRKSFKTKII